MATSPSQPAYNIIDDYGASAGPSGGLTGGTSGEVLYGPFTAPTLAAAAQFAYLFSSITQRPVRLQPIAGGAPYTLITGIGANSALPGLIERLGTLSEHMKAGQMLMVRLAENQMELKPSLARLATIAENSLGQDDVLRTHLRNIEAYMARLSEDIVEGRSQTMLELRSEIRLLARTIAAISDESGR